MPVSRNTEYALQYSQGYVVIPAAYPIEILEWSDHSSAIAV
jgi:hypothetical protein